MRLWDCRGGLHVAARYKPTSILGRAREILACQERVKDIVVQKAVTEEVCEGTEVVETMEADDDVGVSVVSSKFPAEGGLVDVVS